MIYALTAAPIFRLSLIREPLITSKYCMCLSCCWESVKSVIPFQKLGSHLDFHYLFNSPKTATQRAKIIKRFTNLPWSHYIEWPVFSDIGLNCESQGEKGRTCRKYKILIESLFSLLYMISLFHPGICQSPRGGLETFSVISALCAPL